MAKDTLYLTRDGTSGYSREIALPNWKSFNDIILKGNLERAVKEAKYIIIGISSLKQDILARKIHSVNPNASIFCLGAAIYTQPKFNSESVVNTLGTMFISDPQRTFKKLYESLFVFTKCLFAKNDKIKLFVNLHLSNRK